MKNVAIRYNCTIIDLANREAVTTQNSNYITSNLAINILNKAIEREKSNKGLVLHSDQGVQFTSSVFTAFCKEKGINQSMSKAYRLYDNTPTERFYKSFKGALINLNYLSYFLPIYILLV